MNPALPSLHGGSHEILPISPFKLFNLSLILIFFHSYKLQSKSFFVSFLERTGGRRHNFNYRVACPTYLYFFTQKKDNIFPIFNPIGLNATVVIRPCNAENSG